MKKILLAFVIVFFVVGCTASPQSGNNNGGLTNFFNQNNDTNTDDDTVVTDDIVVVAQPTPRIKNVAFEFQDRGFDMEFYYQQGAYFYQGVLQVPSPCYNVDVVYSVLDTQPEQVVIDISTIITGGNCAQELTTKIFNGFIPVDKGARFSLRIDGRQAALFFPTATPRP